MNRTVLILGGAAALAVVALVAGLPRLQAAARDPAPAPTAPKVARDGSLSLTARLSHPAVAPGPQDVFAVVDLRGVEVPGRQRAPVNLALVIDRSGSMAGFKLEQAKRAAQQLVALLGPADRLTLVHYGSDVKTFEGLLATPENKARLLAFIDTIWDDGGTNIGEALAAARAALLEGAPGFSVNRLILVSDGQPTEGLTDPAALEGVVREVRAAGVSVSCLGVGEDFNEQLMQAMAEVGAGAYGYLQDASRLAPVFEKDLAAAGTQVALGVSLSFRVPRGTQLKRVLGHGRVARRLESDGEVVTVALPDFAAGQAERVVAELSVEGAAGGAPLDVSTVTLAYTDLVGAGGPRRSSARLTATTLTDPRAVEAQTDPEAVVFAARARAAANAEAAAERVGQGDLVGARALLHSNQVLFEEASRVAGPKAVDEDLKANQANLQAAEGAHSDVEVRIYQKAVNQQARKGYGLMGSTY
jgi:Ca-activated chloride channel homolog